MRLPFIVSSQLNSLPHGSHGKRRLQHISSVLAFHLFLHSRNKASQSNSRLYRMLTVSRYHFWSLQDHQGINTSFWIIDGCHNSYALNQPLVCVFLFFFFLRPLIVGILFGCNSEVLRHWLHALRIGANPYTYSTVGTTASQQTLSTVSIEDG